MTPSLSRSSPGATAIDRVTRLKRTIVAFIDQAILVVIELRTAIFILKEVEVLRLKRTLIGLIDESVPIAVIFLRQPSSS